MSLLEWTDYQILGNSVAAWTLSAGLFVVAWVVLGLARRVLRNRLKALAEATSLTALEIAERVLHRTQGWFLVVIAFFIASRLLDVPENVATTISRVVMLLVLLQAGLWLAAAFAGALDAKREQELEDNPGAVAALDVLGFVVRLGVWGLIVLVALDNLGINITTLVAGLGIGGVAVALAAQNVLGDLFASLSIVLDKPFVVGDFLILGDHLGTVEKVGIKTTRLRSLSGEQLVFSNNDLLGSRIRNYGRMFERRVVFSLGVTYQTPAAKLELIPKIIRDAIEANDKVRFDRAHFQSYGDFALVFEVVYYVLSPDYNLYMDIQQNINLTIYRRFADEGIEFAYPTQTVFVTREA